MRRAITPPGMSSQDIEAITRTSTVQIARASDAPHRANSTGWISDSSIGITLKRSPQQAGFFFDVPSALRSAPQPPPGIVPVSHYRKRQWQKKN
jgi:hypothetical protein